MHNTGRQSIYCVNHWRDITLSRTVGLTWGHFPVRRKKTFNDQRFFCCPRCFGASANMYLRLYASASNRLMSSFFQCLVGRFCKKSMIPWKEKESHFIIWTPTTGQSESRTVIWMYLYEKQVNCFQLKNVQYIWSMMMCDKSIHFYLLWLQHSANYKCI